MHKSLHQYIHPVTHKACTTVTPYRTLALTFVPAPHTTFTVIGTYGKKNPSVEYTTSLLNHINNNSMSLPDTTKHLACLGDFNDISSPLDTPPTRSVQSKHWGSHRRSCETPLSLMYSDTNMRHYAYTHTPPPKKATTLRELITSIYHHYCSIANLR